MKCLYAAVLLVCFAALFENSHGCSCPEGTAIRVIEKNTDPEDKKMLDVETTCKNDKGKVLHKCKERAENPFGPEVQVHSFQYKGVLTNTVSTSGGDSHKENGGLELFD